MSHKIDVEKNCTTCKWEENQQMEYPCKNAVEIYGICNAWEEKTNEDEEYD